MREKILSKFDLIKEINNTNSIGFFVFNFLSVIINFLIISILGNYLSLENFGYYQSILYYVGIFSIFRFTGMDTIISRELINKNKKFIKFTLLRIMPISCFLIILLFIVFLLLKNDQFYLISIACVLSLVSLFDKYFLYLETIQEFTTIRFFIFFERVSILFFILIIVFFELSFLFFIISYFCISLIFLIIKIYLMVTKLKLKELDLEYNYKLIKLGSERSIVVMVSMISNYLEGILLSFINPVLIAKFALGDMFLKQFKNNFLKIIMKPLTFKWLIKGNLLRKNQIYFFVYLFFGIITALIFYYFIPFVISVLFSKFKDFNYFYKYLGLTLILAYVVYFFSQDLLYSKKIKLLNKIDLSNALFRILITSVLIYYYQINGAIISLIFCTIIKQLTIIFFYFKGIKDN